MNSDWQEVKLEDITSIFGDGLLGTPKYTGSGKYFFINGNNLDNGKISINEQTKKVDFNEYIKIKKDLNDRTILISINGTLGNIALYNGEKVCLGKSACYFNVLDNVDKQFVRYIMTSDIFKHYLDVNATGTTIKNMGLKAMRQFSFLLPPLPIQKKIAHILSTLDDKIELNRKMNQTLEEMASAIFKSWFVDFDPVHAKANCTDEAEFENIAKELGISKEILDLFPSEFIESELGMIPKGWEIISLDQIANYQNGLALQKFRPKDENEFLPVLKIADLTRGYTDSEEKADINIKPECKVFNGDIIFSWSGTLLVDIWCGGNAALNQHLFKVTSETYSKWFYYYWTKQHLANFQHIAASKAVTMGHIKRSHLTEAICFVPNETLFAHAEKILSPLVEKQIINKLEIFELQKTRDTLLPKLLSGEIDVSELEI